MDFVNTVNDYYYPLSFSIAEFQASRSKKQRNKVASFIGIQGTQGSGKSTCASFLKLILEAEYGLSVVVASIDDFYLTRIERLRMAEEIHPLFATRGVPGTHDVAMMHDVFDKAETGIEFTIPLFNKASDDRELQDRWQKIDHAVDILILEGWCVGIDPQDETKLNQPVNELEKIEDVNCVWREYANNALSKDYKELFDRLTLLVSLQAPNFSCVLGWRQLQEEKMIAKLKQAGEDIAMAQTPEQIIRFISYYQRLTEHALATMHSKADYLLELNEKHQFTALTTR